MSTIFQPNEEASNISNTSKTLSGSGATVNVPIFRITGTVECVGLYGVVTTTFGATQTGIFFRLNDQSAQTNITLNTVGATMSAFAVGGIIAKTALAATLATVKNANVGQFYEGATAGIPLLSPFTVTKKNGANTDIEFQYTTADTPTSGVIQFFLEWIPRSADAAVTPQ